jgi:carbon-monoxide dehydrogenase small subunit
MSEHHIEVDVNGAPIRAVVEARRTLADFLRQNVGCTGVHVGCEHGVCGACTVIVDGKAIRGCLMFAVQADGAAVTTLEGLAGSDGALHPAQQAMLEAHGLQCGFCTPGVVMTMAALIADGPVSEADLHEAVSGHLCRCTGYQGILRAARKLAQASGEAAA